jgi:ribosomal protein S18 acetylase RimI-like enzyme
MTHDSLLDKWEQTLTRMRHGEGICAVAVADGRVIGYVVCGKAGGDVISVDWELYAMYVFAEHQGKGIGKQLFSHAIEEMKKRNGRSCILWVLKENYGARKFYESFAPDITTERNYAFGEQEYELIGYGWSDISTIT